MQHLDETGVVITGCCHVIAQNSKALNIFRREIYTYCIVLMLLYFIYADSYGYTHFLHMHYLSQRNPNFLM